VSACPSMMSAFAWIWLGSFMVPMFFCPAY
jgi:hypothetical protein